MHVNYHAALIREVPCTSQYLYLPIRILGNGSVLQVIDHADQGVRSSHSVRVRLIFFDGCHGPGSWENATE
jgi:hypothetical protein